MGSPRPSSTRPSRQFPTRICAGRSSEVTIAPPRTPVRGPSGMHTRPCSRSATTSAGSPAPPLAVSIVTASPMAASSPETSSWRPTTLVTRPVRRGRAAVRAASSRNSRLIVCPLTRRAWRTRSSALARVASMRVASASATQSPGETCGSATMVSGRPPATSPRSPTSSASPGLSRTVTGPDSGASARARTTASRPGLCASSSSRPTRSCVSSNAMSGTRLSMRATAPAWAAISASAARAMAAAATRSSSIRAASWSRAAVRPAS